MPTPFSEERKAFSESAHIAARKALYPGLFCVPHEQLSFDDQGDIKTDERWGALDGEMAIDRLIRVTVVGFRQPITFAVQERFRTPEFARFRDLTVTEWNTRTNRESELYKLHAGLFLYGYFDKERGTFIEAVCANVPALMMSLITRTIPFTHELKRNGSQTFIGLKFDDMHRAKVLEYHYKAFPNNLSREWNRAQPTVREASA